MTHYHLDYVAQTARINDEPLDPLQYPILRLLLHDMTQDGVSTLSYYDAVGLGSAEGKDFAASWDPYTVSITTNWDDPADLDDVYDTLKYLARAARDYLPHARDRSAKVLGPVHVNVDFGPFSRVTVFRGSTRVAAIVGDEHLNFPMRDLLSDWCADMQDYAYGVDVTPFIGASLSKNSVMFRDADLVQHRPEDAPGTENVARELRARFDELTGLLDGLNDPRKDSE